MLLSCANKLEKCHQKYGNVQSNDLELQNTETILK